MARDSGGTYTLPSNSFAEPIAGTAINPTDATTTLNDIATEIQDSLSRSGKGGMTADLQMGGHNIQTCNDIHIAGSFVLGSDASGDIYYRNGSAKLARLAKGSDSNVLTLSGGLPSWQAGSSAASVTVGTTTIASGTDTRILFDNAGVLGERATVPVANGGTNDTGSAWTTSTPSVTSSGGTITTASCAFAYKALGKTVWFRAAVTITTSGTGSGFIQFTVPSGTTNAAVAGGGYNTTTAVSTIWSIPASSTTLSIAKYDGTTQIGNGNVIVITGVYETT